MKLAALLPRRAKMPRQFVVLADYNAEVARGVQHTPERREQMAHLQAQFNDWIIDGRR